MVKRKIVICSESLRLSKRRSEQDEKYSIDGEAIIDLLKKNLAILQSDQVAIEAVGFGGKDEFMREIPYFVLSKFAEYRHLSNGVELFIIALRDSKLVVQNVFVQCGRRYTPLQLLDLLPQLRVAELRRCKHFKEFYDCVRSIAEAPH